MKSKSKERIVEKRTEQKNSKHTQKPWPGG